MVKELTHFIDGEHVKGRSGRFSDVYNPATGEVQAKVPLANAEELQAAVDSAKAAQPGWAARPMEDRRELVLKATAIIGGQTDRMAKELAWQMGRPVKYGGEFKGFNERSNYMASIAGEALAPLVIEDSAAFKRSIAREPHGVVFVIAPWNYPYMTAINTVAPALIAGNTVVLKHASQTLLVGERMAEALPQSCHIISDLVFDGLALACPMEID